MEFSSWYLNQGSSLFRGELLRSLRSNLSRGSQPQPFDDKLMIELSVGSYGLPLLNPLSNICLWHHCWLASQKSSKLASNQPAVCLDYDDDNEASQLSVGWVTSKVACTWRKRNREFSTQLLDQGGTRLFLCQPGESLLCRGKIQTGSWSFMVFGLTSNTNLPLLTSCMMVPERGREKMELCQKQ